MASTMSGHPLSYLNYPTSTPFPRSARPFLKGYGEDLEPLALLSCREQVVRPTSRYSTQVPPLADSPPAHLSLWVQSGDPRLSPKPSSREAKAWQVTSLKTKATSAGTATHIECLPAPLGNGNPQDTQFQGPKGFPRPTGTLGGNSLTGTDCLFRGMVSNT